MKSFFYAAALAFLTAPLQAQTAADVAGDWEMTVNSPQGASQATLSLKKDGDKLTGLIKSPRGERELESVTLKGNDIVFGVKRNLQGNDVLFTYTGKVEKDAMKGAVDFGGLATGDWSAARKSAGAAATGGGAAPAPPPPASSGPAVDVSGTWLFNVDTGAGSGQPTFTFKQEGEKLTGTYSGAFGKANLSGTVKSNEIKFSFTADAGGQSADITYTGKVTSKDSMQGSVQLGGFGEGTWSGKRQ
jgi:hypothetical protein